MKYAVVVDSTTKLRKEFLKKIEDKVEVVTIPVRVYIDDKEYEDSEEVSEEIIDALENEKKLETSLPLITKVEETFEELSNKYQYVYVLSVSSLLSGTYNLFNTIASKYENIIVFDSKTVSIQNTYIFERMITDILNGKILEENDIISYRDDSLFLISVFDLNQLNKSGRIGKISSFIGQMIHIKPTLTVARTGEVELVGKSLSTKKLIELMISKFESFIEKNKVEGQENYVLYAAVGSDDYKQYVYEISKHFNIKPVFLEIGPAVMAHVGLHGFGILIAKGVNYE